MHWDYPNLCWHSLGMKCKLIHKLVLDQWTLHVLTPRFTEAEPPCSGSVAGAKRWFGLFGIYSYECGSMPVLEYTTMNLLKIYKTITKTCCDLYCVQTGNGLNEATTFFCFPYVSQFRCSNFSHF